MTGRKTLEDLLGPISAQLGRDAVPENVELPEWQHVPVRATDGLSQEALVDMFAAEAEKIRVTVHRCTKDQVAAEIAGIVAADHGSVVLAADAELQEMGIADALADSELTVWDPAAGEANVEAARVAKYGITLAQSGIAESATVVQPVSPTCGRAISLLPLTHIAVIDANSVVGIMADALRPYHQGELPMPSQICMISGPSATSDIELVRVEGVHGPMYVHYVIAG